MHGSSHVGFFGPSGFFWSKKSRSFAELPCAQMWGSCNATWITWSRCLGWDRSVSMLEQTSDHLFLRKKWRDFPWTTRWGVSTNQIYLFFKVFLAKQWPLLSSVDSWGLRDVMSNSLKVLNLYCLGRVTVLPSIGKSIFLCFGFLGC